MMDEEINKVLSDFVQVFGCCPCISHDSNIATETIGVWSVEPTLLYIKPTVQGPTGLGYL